MELYKRSRPLTELGTVICLLQCVRRSQRLKNTGIISQRMVNSVCIGKIEPSNNLIIYGRRVNRFGYSENHIEDMEGVLDI